MRAIIYKGMSHNYLFKFLKTFFSRTLKDGYESDSTLSYRRHQYIPQQSQNKSLYTQVQKGGEVPHQGLRMQAPDKRGRKIIIFLHENLMAVFAEKFAKKYCMLIHIAFLWFLQKISKDKMHLHVLLEKVSIYKFTLICT